MKTAVRAELVEARPCERRAAQGLSDSGTIGRWLRPLRGDWPAVLCRRLEQEPAVARVLVMDARGSTPRESGACMLVTRHDTDGTIGGGRLEWQAVEAARALLADGNLPAAQRQHLVLGHQLGQCCGGVVHLWVERFTRADLPLLRKVARRLEDGERICMETTLRGVHAVRRLVNVANSARRCDSGESMHLIERIDASLSPLWLYGAGHVGQALVRVLSDLPLRITWIDSRAELLPAGLPDNVHALQAEDPVAIVRDAPPDARHLVMTHDHGLDYALCRALLLRGEFAWLGLIGSRSKGARFRSRLAREGVPPQAIAQLVCPIGLGGATSKWPAAIAIDVAAQLLHTMNTARPEDRQCSESSAAPVQDGCSAGACPACSSRGAAC